MQIKYVKPFTSNVTGVGWVKTVRFRIDYTQFDLFGVNIVRGMRKWFVVEEVMDFSNTVQIRKVMQMVSPFWLAPNNKVFGHFKKFG